MPASLRNLRPAQARLIAAIHQHGQLQTAAAACHMSQPAASRILAELEKTLETPLFLRTPKGMEPTAAGELVARHAARLSHDLYLLSSEFEALRGGQAGAVRVGAVTGPALGQLVPAIQRIKEETPNIDISVEVAPSVILSRRLEAGDLDFALCRLPATVDSRDYIVEPARDEIVRLLVRTGHPMLSEDPMPISALHHLPWVLQERGAPIRSAIETAFADESLSTPDDVITTSSLLLIIALLSRSDAIAPISQEVVNLLLDAPVSASFGMLQLNRPITVEPYMIVRNRDRTITQAAERLLDAVRQNIRQLGPHAF